MIQIAYLPSGLNVQIFRRHKTNHRLECSTQFYVIPCDQERLHAQKRVSSAYIFGHFLTEKLNLKTVCFRSS